MKYLLFLFWVLGFIACRKEEIDPYAGKLQAKLNNGFGLVGMKAVAISATADSFSLIGIVVEDDVMKWQLDFYKVPKKVGRFTFPVWDDMSPAITITEWLADGDVIGRGYYLPESKPTNYIEITSYNSTTGDIEGYFGFTTYVGYYNGRNEIAFDLQDSMSFTNGEFYTRIRP